MSRLPGARRARGFSLVEALVALVVLSVGMLGIAGLYLESLRSGRVTILRSQAVTLASDLADRIRANRLGGAGYTHAVADEPATVGNCLDAAGACTPAQMAETDKAQWVAAVAAALPGGAGEVEVDAATAPDTYTITITWVEPGIGDQTYVLSFQT